MGQTAGELFFYCRFFTKAGSGQSGVFVVRCGVGSFGGGLGTLQWRSTGKSVLDLLCDPFGSQPVNSRRCSKVLNVINGNCLRGDSSPLMGESKFRLSPTPKLSWLRCCGPFCYSLSISWHGFNPVLQGRQEQESPLRRKKN